MRGYAPVLIGKIALLGFMAGCGIAEDALPPSPGLAGKSDGTAISGYRYHTGGDPADDFRAGHRFAGCVDGTARASFTLGGGQSGGLGIMDVLFWGIPGRPASVTLASPSPHWVGSLDAHYAVFGPTEEAFTRSHHPIGSDPDQCRACTFDRARPLACNCQHGLIADDEPGHFRWRRKETGRLLPLRGTIEIEALPYGGWSPRLTYQEHPSLDADQRAPRLYVLRTSLYSWGEEAVARRYTLTVTGCVPAPPLP